MIDPDIAGVMFTSNPLTGAADEIHIDATWGVGEAVITARYKPDHFVVSKKESAVQTRVIVDKSVMDVISMEGGLQTIMVPSDKQEIPCMTDEQVLALAALGQRVEAHFQSSQDIDWCSKDGKIRLLQTKPRIRNG